MISLCQSIHVYLWESAEKFTGWWSYSHGMGPNEVYFSTVTIVVHTLLPSVLLCLDPIGKKVINSRYYIIIWAFQPKLLSIYLSIYHSLFISIFQSIYPLMFISINLSIYLSILDCIYLFFYPNLFIFLCLFICLSIIASSYLSILVFLYLSILIGLSFPLSQSAQSYLLLS